MLILGAIIAILQLRRDAIADTVNENRRLGTVLAEQTMRSFQAVDLVLQQLADEVHLKGITDPKSLHDAFGRRDVHEALSKRLIDLPQALSFAIVDANGRYVVSARDFPAPNMNAANRPFFKHILESDDPGPDISDPTIGVRSHVPVVLLSRRLTSADGTFLGIATAPVRLAYFKDLLSKAGFSDGTAVTILRTDGTVLLRFPMTEADLGAVMPKGAAWYRMVAEGGGPYRSPGVFGDKSPAYVSVHPLTTYPIVLDASRKEQAALANWQRQAAMIGAGVLLVTLLSALLLRALGRQIALIESARERIAQQVETITASEARLSERTEQLQSTLESMNQGLLMVDAAGILVLCNRRAAEMLDLPYDWVTSRPRAADVVAYQVQRGEFDGPADATFERSQLLDDRAIFERRRTNGMVFEARTAPLPQGGWVRTYTDISARAAAEEMLGLAASHDQLTGLANRNGLGARLDAALAAAQRAKTELALLCLDLDRFKAINDTLGHEAGDRLLIQVAQRMQQIGRDGDIIGRLGGDEFAIVLPGASLNGAEQVSQRLLESIGQPYDLGGSVGRIGVSIGVAIYPLDGGTAEQLLRNADTALYKAKSAGRNNWRAYTSEEGDREHKRMALEQDIRTAVEQQQFTLAFQPICDTTTRTPLGFEALLRWNHPERGAISPAEFIPIAEQTGTIIPLGRWVIEAACAQAAAWAIPLRVAVNLSPAQFRDHDLLEFITNTLAQTGLAAERLELEVTEGLLLEDLDSVVRTMQALRGMGIRMILDDFGTAHSNLSYLRGLPFDGVKIDRSFLRALNSDAQARALVEAMLAMARALGLDVVGEGVETPEQLALLSLLQCRCAQGYLLGRPQPPDVTRELVWTLAGARARGPLIDGSPSAAAVA